MTTRGDVAGEMDVRPRSWLVVLALVSMAAGVAFLWPISFTTAVAGLVLSSIVPAVALAQHNQRAQLQAVAAGIYLPGWFIHVRRLIVLAAVVLAGLHGFRFALALELAVFS